MLFAHDDEGTPVRLQLDTTSQNAAARSVAFTRQHIGGREEIHVSLKPSEAFRHYDEKPDEEFYSVPRLVTHINAPYYKTP
jgi:hypothetical protein